MKKYSSLVIALLLLGAGCGPAQQSAQAEGKVLATSSDHAFVLRGTGTCNGDFAISYDKTSGMYNLSVRQSKNSPESEDLGSVKVQTGAQYQADVQGHKLYATAFKNDAIVVSSYMTSAAGSDCNLRVTDK